MSCESETGCQQNGQEHSAQQDAMLQTKLASIKKKILVLSGKGGVGKSTFAVSLASALERSGKKIGLFDSDFHGPSVPVMTGLSGNKVVSEFNEFVPPQVGNLKVLSIDFFLEERDAPVVWRGPMKMAAAKQFLAEAVWGELDYLVVDLPPGTGDEPLSICQLLDKTDGAVIVTTPQQVSISDVRRCLRFCEMLKVPVLGIVENMAGFACPECNKVTDVFGKDGGKRLAEETGLDFLGSVPIDPVISEKCDQGELLRLAECDSTGFDRIQEIADRIAYRCPIE